MNNSCWIKPEFDRQGWAVCLFWLQGGKHDEALTDRNSRLTEPQQGGPLDPLFEERN